MGVGLSICQSIVKSHRGELRAATRKPYGSVFTIIIPAAPPETQELTPAAKVALS
jgi:signal transduction histidine kinase